MALVVRLSPPCVSESRLKRGEHTQNIVLHTFCKHIWLVAEIAVTAIFLKDEGKRESEEKSESLHRLIYSARKDETSALLLIFFPLISKPEQYCEYFMYSNPHSCAVGVCLCKQHYMAGGIMYRERFQAHFNA